MYGGWYEGVTDRAAKSEYGTAQSALMDNVNELWKENVANSAECVEGGMKGLQTEQPSLKMALLSLDTMRGRLANQ